MSPPPVFPVSFIHEGASSVVHYLLPVGLLAHLVFDRGAVGYLAIVITTTTSVQLKYAMNSLANRTALGYSYFTVLVVLQELLHLQAVAGLALC